MTLKKGEVQRNFKDDKSLLFLYFIKQKKPLTNSTHEIPLTNSH